MRCLHFSFYSIAALSLLTVWPALAPAQEIIPSSRDLERLNLTVAWKRHLPVTDHADGIAQFQRFGDQIFIQTKTNLVVVLDERTGEEIWRMEMPKRNRPTFPVGVNRDLACVLNGPRVYVLDRRDGRLRYKVDLPSTAAAGLAADNHQCFVPLANNRLISIGLLPEDLQRGLYVRQYIERPDAPTGIKLQSEPTAALSTVNNRTPSIGILHTLQPPYKNASRDVTPSLAIVSTISPPYRPISPNRSASLQMLTDLKNVGEYSEISTEDRPRILWDLQANRRITETPLMYSDVLVMLAGDRSIFVTSKYADRQNRIRHDYRSDSPFSAPLTRYGANLVACVADGNVYEFDIDDFQHADVPVKQSKRFLAGLPIDRVPVTTDDSVFLAGTQAGVIRLNRLTFDRLWANTDVDRLVAIGPTVVYARDRRGYLVVLDRSRGLKLSSIDMRAFNFPITNDMDDRLFLASESGQLICLHDRSTPRAQLLRPKEPKPPVDLNEEPMREAPPAAKKEAAPAKKDEADAKKDEMPKKDPEPKKEP